MPTLRIQFHRAGLRSGGQSQPVASAAISSANLAITGVATVSGSQITVPADGPFALKLKAIGSECYVAVGATPDPTAEPRMHLLDGESEWVYALAGEKIAVISSALDA
jgi:hypothetical protein